MARQLGRTYLPDIVEPGKLASERAPSLGCCLLCNVHNFISSPGKGGGGGGAGDLCVGSSTMPCILDGARLSF